jgi:hypothetical protein
MRLTGTGKRRINTVVRLEARVAGRRVLGLELALVVAPELVRAAAELERGQVAAELELAPVAVKLEPGQVVAELGLVRVVVALVLGQVAVALRTKSVIALHRHGLPRLAVED